jgi:hypothetical protein
MRRRERRRKIEGDEQRDEHEHRRHASMPDAGRYAALTPGHDDD